MTLNNAGLDRNYVPMKENKEVFLLRRDNVKFKIDIFLP